MDDYLCVTVVGKLNEPEAAFKARLSEFWTHMLRNRPDDYEKVYSEAVVFEWVDGKVARRYMVRADGVAALTAELRAAGLDFEPVDEDDLYSKYEASSPDWFQIEH